jgi:peptide/nickel transport system permease protein
LQEVSIPGFDGRMNESGPLPATGRNRKFLWAGIGILLLFTVAGIWAGMLNPAVVKHRGLAYLPPSWSHPLGTDDMGYDLLISLCTAGRISLLIGIGAAGIAVFLGTVIGLLAGFLRKPWANLLTGFIDSVLLIPMLPFMILLAAYLGQHILNVILAIALIGWCSTARAVRSRVMQLREMPFVEALTSLGLKDRRIIFCHLLPNIVEIISAKFVLSVAGAMLSESALSFLGLGDPVRLSWGKMVHDAFERGGFAGGLWNWYLPPGLCITLCTLGFVFLGLYGEQQVRSRLAAVDIV